MLEFAIRKSGDAITQVSVLLLCLLIAMLGLVWLSIALAGLLAIVVPTPMAAAITGAVLVAAALLTYSLRQRSMPNSRSEAAPVSESKCDELVTRATRIAERLAPESPIIALGLAALAGWASVSVPASLNPVLNKLIDDIEKAPNLRPNV